MHKENLHHLSILFATAYEVVLKQDSGGWQSCIVWLLLLDMSIFCGGAFLDVMNITTRHWIANHGL